MKYVYELKCDSLLQMCDLRELSTIIDGMAQLSAQFYGPCCKQTLLISKTGNYIDKTLIPYHVTKF